MKDHSLNLAIRAPYRLVFFRQQAEQMNAQPHRVNADKVNWRDVRRESFARTRDAFDTATLSIFGTDEYVRVSFFDPSISHGWRVTYADQVEHSAIDHQGWYMDCDGDGSRGVLRGAVAAFSHGRYVPMVHNSDTGGWFVFDSMGDSARDAAQAADSYAKELAEQESEYQRRWQEANDMRERLGEIKGRLAELQVLIDSGKFDNAQAEADRLTQEAADITDKLNDEFADVAE
ncbi:hypothetical protein ADP64_000069 [Achromobacter phage phiAxp-2]|uniref:Uncharacterized protein n=1 Tax=Achromobacter phage phiAxp-2 TaxID=1664246 RepID=A0A0K2FI10_9CAUD|nr:hypothetical protein ADP64_000069 [Achromobacter phage phiAxp-2]ALA45401.1 hypothetical protein ADP64_000069 [Achromobacter phage phiAxp-2]